MLVDAGQSKNSHILLLLVVSIKDLIIYIKARNLSERFMDFFESRWVVYAFGFVADYPVWDGCFPIAPTKHHVPVVRVKNRRFLASAFVNKSFDIGCCSIFSIAIGKGFLCIFFGIGMWILPFFTSMSSRVQDYEWSGGEISTKEVKNLVYF